MQIHKEEYKLATLCLQYLLFDCFDVSLSDDSIKDYILGGHYALQDYAVLHWVDHLEASIPQLESYTADNEDGLGPSISDFYEAYAPFEASQKDIPEDLKTRCQHLAALDYFESLLLLVGSTRLIRGRKENIAALGSLGTIVTRARASLEKLHTAASTDPSVELTLQQYYGQNWYKCPRHACFNFHEGFSNPSTRDSHVNRHEKPFLCTEASCTRKHLGFATEKELKKHSAIMHPDPAVLLPKVKKPPAKHVCDICSKDFTRAHNLNAHKRTHENLRPYKCHLCDKAFVRKYDCERHVDKLHPDIDSAELEPSDEVQSQGNDTHDSGN